MKEKIMNAKPLYHKTLFIYTLLFAVYTLFGRVTLLHGLVEHTINSFVFILAGFFGLMLFGIDLLFYRDFMKMRYWKVFALFIVCAGISTALNVSYGVRSNLTTLIWLIDQMLLFASMGYFFTRERYDKWLTWFFRICGVIWGLASAGSLYQYFFVPGFRIFMNERWIRQSFYDNRLFGVFIDPNLGAFVGFLVILGMIYLVKQETAGKNRKWINVLCYVNVAVQIFYIILSGSRSVEVCMVVSISYALILKLVGVFQKKKTSLMPRILSFIAVPVVLSVLILGSFQGVKLGVSYFAKNVTTATKHETDELERTDIEGDASNNRSDIWKGYLVLWKDKPIFGISPRNGWNYADKEHPEGYIANHHYDVHNAYVAVLEGMGIVGAAVLLLLMFLLLKNMLPMAFSPEKMDLTRWMAVQLILNIAVFICFYPGIFFTNGIDTVLFWPAIGYVLQCTVASKDNAAVETSAEQEND